MDKVFDSIQNIPLSGNQIKESLGGHTKIITYKELKQYDNIDDVLYPYDNVVILYETKPRYGHWVCIMKHKNNIIEYYDPYGEFVDEPLNHIERPFKYMLGGDFPYLSYLLYISPYDIIYNDKQLQEKNDNIATCGRHIISRILLNEIPLKKYQKIFRTENKVNADDKVSYLTAGIINFQ